MYLTVFVEQLKHSVYHVRVEHLTSGYINRSLEFLCGGDKEVEISDLRLTEISYPTIKSSLLKTLSTLDCVTRVTQERATRDTLVSHANIPRRKRSQ